MFFGTLGIKKHNNETNETFFIFGLDSFVGKKLSNLNRRGFQLFVTFKTQLK